MDTEESTYDVNDSVDESTTEQESSPVEQQDSQADDTSEEVSGEDTEGETEDSDGNDSEEADDTESDDTPQSKGEQRKTQLNTEIRDLVAQRNQLRQQVEQVNSQAYKTSTVDDLLEQVNPDTGDYYNRLEAQLESMRQEREVEKYNNQVAEAQLGLSHEAQRALEDFPMFDASSPEFDAQLAAEVDQILGSSIQIDQRTGQVIGSNISPYQLYKSHAMAARSSATKAEVKAKKDTAKMLTNADRPTGGRGKAGGVPFEKMTTKQMEASLRKKGYDV